MKTNYPKWLHSAEKLLRRLATPSAAGSPKPGRDSAHQIRRLFQALVETISCGHPSRFCLGEAGFRARKNLISALG